MNILYLSMGTSNPWAGPTYSIPRQIKAQKQFDNVFWYDLTHSKDLKFQENVAMWKETGLYHDLDDYPEMRIDSLPYPFSSPDVVVFEQFYTFTMSKILKDPILLNTPYVIIPRGELTFQAQKRSRIKKYFANLLISKKFAADAASIHYLTEQEMRDSTSKWNSKFFIIPNGVEQSNEYKRSYNSTTLKFVSIGRIEKYQKGLDMLLAAIASIKDELMRANAVVDIFGPDRNHQLDDLNCFIRDNHIEKIVSFHDGVFGEEKKKILLKSDVFLMTSRFEGHPTAMIEALSYGLPCVATTGSNMMQEIEERKAGWGCDCTSDSICTALIAAIKERNNLFKYGRNARNLSLKYDWKEIAKRNHDMLAVVCGKKKEE